MSSSFDRAVALHQAGRLYEAASLYREVLAATPSHAGALHYLGTIALQTGDPKRAIGLVEKALELEANRAEAWDHLGLAYRQAERPDLAVSAHQHSLELAPDVGATHSNLALALLEAGDPRQARRAALEAVRLSPDLADAHNNLGIIVAELNERDQAERCYRRALELAPNHFEAQLGLVELTVTRRNDPALARLQSLVSLPDIPEPVARRAHFVLGHVYDRIGDHAVAWRHFRRGNELRKKRFGGFDAGQTRRRYARLMALDRPFFDAHAGLGHPSTRPIFIVGLPRSGTTLVERIIASCDDVVARGERLALHAMANDLVANDDFGPKLRQSPIQLERLAEAYLEQLPVGARCTDKLPVNFENLWLIALLFPQASVVHCIRDPRDTCLSLYFRDFAYGHTYANDLTALAEYHRLYTSLMAHWRDVLPLQLTEVAYEELVRDPAAQSRVLLSSCGLTPSATANPGVYQRTADGSARRDAIDDSSVGRWKRYERQLHELLLDDDVDAETPRNSAQRSPSDPVDGVAPDVE